MEANPNFKYGVLITFIISIAVLTAFAGSLYTCDRFNDKYYKAQTACTTGGGTWIPTRGGASALCLNSKYGVKND